VNRFWLGLALASLFSGELDAQQAAPKTSTTANRKPTKPGAVRPDSAATVVFRSADFGFSYTIPFGWVERTEQMQDDSSDKSKGQVLLAAFERPPEASGSTVNSAVVIATESTSSYPKLKTAADYFEPLTELTASKGLNAVTDPAVIAVGTKKLVRGDFSRDDGAVSMYQASLVMLAKGQIVSFTFVGGSEDEVNELIGKLSFGVAVKQ
jgi:hypothetical protein